MKIKWAAKLSGKNAGMLDAWDKFRPSCQKDYDELVMKAKDSGMRVKRIQRLLKMTADYHRRHPKKNTKLGFLR